MPKKGTKGHTKAVVESKKDETNNSLLTKMDGLEKIQAQTDVLKGLFQDNFNKLQEEWKQLEREKALFAETSRKIEGVHFSKVITLNIGMWFRLEHTNTYRRNTLLYQCVYITGRQRFLFCQNV
jgi:hypothetical protein